MTPWTPSERAAITAAERAGRITRLPSPCPYWGGRFDRLLNDGEEMEGQDARPGRFGYSRRPLCKVLREAGISWPNMDSEIRRSGVR